MKGLDEGNFDESSDPLERGNISHKQTWHYSFYSDEGIG